MCGSGTTINVAKELNRKVISFDLSTVRFLWVQVANLNLLKSRVRTRGKIANMKISLKYLTELERKVVGQFAKLVRTALGKNLINIEIFGSKVKGDFTEDSDIDILIVVKERTLDSMDKIAEITADLNIEYNLSISPVIFSEYEYKVNEDIKSPFVLNVEVEGVRL